MTRFRAVLAAMAFSSLAACQSEAPAPDESVASDDNSAAVRTVLTHLGGFAVTYVPLPDPIPRNQHFSIELQIDSKGAPPMTVELDAMMPSHGHGMNTLPEVTPLGNGAFRVDGLLFHMPGSWEIYVSVAGDGAKERATFPVWLK